MVFILESSVTFEQFDGAPQAAYSRDSTPVSHICVRFGSGRLGPCPVPDAGHCGMLGAMR